MERSRVPLPSFLGLFGALLMLSPELLLGIAGRLFEVPATDPEAQGVLAFAVQQYNEDTGDSTNYFKVLRLVKLLREVFHLRYYHFMVELAQTRCEKRAGMKMTYENFQKCPLLPENPKKQICFFKVILVREMMVLPFKSELAVTLCT